MQAEVLILCQDIWICPSRCAVCICFEITWEISKKPQQNCTLWLPENYILVKEILYLRAAESKPKIPLQWMALRLTS